ncbi:MAG: hypothetical protein HUU15_11380, partial [Candidatus Brocadiae bacterium]|nr:hypothetical protein [Candidatus Brocadiia bacterium]
SPARGAAPPPPAAAPPPSVTPAGASRTGPNLRYQDVPTGPGLLTYLLCAAILIGLVFAARWIGGRAMAKVMEDEKAKQQGR